MSYHEFCIQVAPIVLELQDKCREMSKEEFEDFCKKIMEEIPKLNLSQRFMMAALDMIQKNIFEENAIKKSKTA